VPRCGVCRRAVLHRFDWRAALCLTSRRARRFSSLHVLTEDSVTLSPDLLKILVCPKCKGALEYKIEPAEVLVCHACALVYAVQDGIPVMLIDDATPLLASPLA
jgi:uncharacterized protein YbaR (Trm112 family)